MWAVVMFDVPTLTKKDKSQYRAFRDALLSCGMVMLQYSVYVRFFPKGMSSKPLITVVEGMLPVEGRVTVLLVSDREYTSAFRFVGDRYLEKHGEDPDAPEQLTIF